MEEGRKHIDLIADSVALENGRKARREREREQKRVGKGKRRKRRGRGKCGQKQALELEHKI